MHHLHSELDHAVTVIRRAVHDLPRVGLILGTGLGTLADEIEDATRLPVGDLPGFAPSTAIGHQGWLVCGQLAGIPVAAMQGRSHLYEGHSAAQVAFPVRVLKALGAEMLIVTNAAGGLNPQYRCGELVIVDDHLNLMFRNPLVGENDDRLGPRFPDMSAPYDAALQRLVIRAAQRAGFTVHRGVYAGMMGPTYETRAEYRMLRRLGADLVGMSTVPEVIAAVHANLRVLAVSVVTNVCLPDALGVTSGEAVADVGVSVVKNLRRIVVDLLESL